MGRGTCYSLGLASLERLGQPALLVGRRGEYALIGAILDRAAAEGAALLLRSEPGAGKTVLLDAAADGVSAAKAWVLRAAGVEFEAELSFSRLNQLLVPVYEDELHELSAVHREALKIVPGFGEGPGTGPASGAHQAGGSRAETYYTWSIVRAVFDRQSARLPTACGRLRRGRSNRR